MASIKTQRTNWLTRIGRALSSGGLSEVIPRAVRGEARPTPDVDHWLVWSTGPGADVIAEFWGESAERWAKEWANG